MCDHYYGANPADPAGDLVCDMCGAVLPDSAVAGFQDPAEELAARLAELAKAKV